MTTDGGLRQVFRKHIPQAHWQAIESWSTGQGVPDMNYCLEGRDGWIENKFTEAWALQHPLSPEQVAWIERRNRVGGRALLAVRKTFVGGVRRGDPGDEVFIFGPSALRLIAPTNSIKGVEPLLHSTGGPARWDWATICALMKERPE